MVVLFDLVEFEQIKELLKKNEDSSLNIHCRLPIHFIDVPGIEPLSPLGIDHMFSELQFVWVYVALAAQKVRYQIIINIEIYPEKNCKSCN